MCTMSSISENMSKPTYTGHEQSLREQASQVKQSVAGAAEDVKRAAHSHYGEVVESVKHLASEAQCAARDGLDKARTVASDYLHQGRDRAVEFQRTAQSQVRSRPLAAVAIACCVGLAFGLLIRR